MVGEGGKGNGNGTVYSASRLFLVRRVELPGEVAATQSSGYQALI